MSQSVERSAWKKMRKHNYLASIETLRKAGRPLQVEARRQRIDEFVANNKQLYEYIRI